VAVSGSIAVVGAFGHNSDAGAAYVFAHVDGYWFQLPELTASDGAPGNEFGSVVTMSGSTVAVTSFGEGTYAGAGYVFEPSGNVYTQQAELTVPGGSGADFFGEAMAISPSGTLVGANGNNNNAGAAYAFATP